MRFQWVVGPLVHASGKFRKICTYTAAILVWECVPMFNIVRTRKMSCIFSYWTGSHASEWSGGGGPSVARGPNVVVLSAVDGPPGPSVAAVHTLGGTIHGCRTWSGETDCGGGHWLCDSPPPWLVNYYRSRFLCAWRPYFIQCMYDVVMWFIKVLIT